MSEVIVVTSGKGGVGKTTVTANIGAGLAMLGHKVVLIDADTGLRNLDVVLGMENRIVFDLTDVIEGKCRLRQAMIKDRRFGESLFMLPTAQTKDKSAVTEDDLRNICGQLREHFDYVIIDCPAGIEQGFQSAVAGAEKAIVVTAAEVAAVRDADRVVGILESKADIRDPKLIINRLRIEMVQRGDMMTLEDMHDILGLELLGVIPDDEAVVVATNRGEPVVVNEQTVAGRAFRDIVRRIQGEAVPLMNLESREGFFNRLRKIIGFR